MTKRKRTKIPRFIGVFFVVSTNGAGFTMDKLRASAYAFNALLNKEYYIMAGRKGKLIEFTLNFNKCDFFHLAGLHKLRDITSLNSANMNKENIFNKVLNGEITYKQLSKSIYFYNVQDRIKNLPQLEQLLDRGDLVFRFCQHKEPGSNINADYVFYFNNFHPELYFFIVRRATADTKLCGCSFFPLSDNKYISRQTKYTILYIEKKDIINEKKQVLVNKLKDSI